VIHLQVILRLHCCICVGEMRVGGLKAGDHFCLCRYGLALLLLQLLLPYLLLPLLDLELLDLLGCKLVRWLLWWCYGSGGGNGGRMSHPRDVRVCLLQLVGHWAAVGDGADWSADAATELLRRGLGTVRQARSLLCCARLLGWR